jgi:hypothetical protein
MDNGNTTSTAPDEFSPHERAATARLLEATRDHLGEVEGDRVAALAEYLVVTFDRAALAVRRGYRPHVLDAQVAELDRFVTRLSEEVRT